jgi:succinate--hydroxymethylglutarate CoA-transferase
MFVRRALFVRPSPPADVAFNRNCGSGSRPLDGVQVIDMTRVAAGPYCSMILADMGADVIKVERPTTGDDSRGYGPPFVDFQGSDATDGRLSLYFASLNRNKRSVCVDFRHPDGKTIVEKLAQRSHVLIENYIPGTLDR